MAVSRYRIAAAVLGCLLLAAGGPAFAQRYRVGFYTEGEGLPSSDVYALTQDASGRLWFATRGGVAGYDGLDWEVHPLPRGVPSAFETTWQRGDDGRLWALGNHRPGRLFRFDAGRWMEITGPPGRSGEDEVIAFAAAAQTEPRVALGMADGTVAVLQRGAWTSRSIGEEPVMALAFQGDRLLIGTSGGVLVYDLARPASGLRPLPGTLGWGVRALATAEASVWIVGQGRIGRLDGDRLATVRDLSGFDLAGKIFVEPDRHGGAYVGSWQGLIHVGAADEPPGVLGMHNGLGAEGATDLLVDREGILWVASRRGVSRISDVSIAGYDSSQGLLDDEVTALLQLESGETLVAHNAGFSFFGDSISTVPLDSAGGRTRVLDLDQDASGRILAAVEGIGLVEIGPDHEPRVLPGLHTRTRSVRVDSLDRIWIAAEDGIYRFDGEFQRVDFPGGPPVGGIRRLFAEDDGGLFVATVGSGLWLRGDSGWQRWQADGAREANNLYAVEQARDGSLWVGTGGGLYRAEGASLRRSKAPEVGRPVYFLTEDDAERLWIGTDNGVLVWDGKALQSYTVEDGLIGRETNRAAGLVDPAGRIWVGTDRGLSIIQPESVGRQQVPPIVDLLGVETREGLQPLDAPLKLSSADRNLVFHFRAISFRSGVRLRIQQRLEGFDRGWLPIRDTPRRESRYTHLPPGEYRYHLKAASAHGPWSPVVSTLPITIRAPVWQQLWFRGLAVLLVVGLTYGLHRHLAQRRYARRLEREVASRVEELRHSEERGRRVEAAERHRLEVTLGSIADGVIATDMEGRIQLINPTAAALTGRNSRDAVGERLADVLSVTDGDGRPLDPLREVVADAADPGAGRPFRGSLPEGRQLELSGAPLLDPELGRVGTVLAFRDVTEKLRDEEEVLRAQRLESLGVLAGGIAHDFNNLLTVVLGNISLVQFDKGVEPPSRENLANAEAAILRARDLTLQLLTFSRGGAPVRRAAPIDEVLRESAAFVLSGTSVRVEIDLPDDLWSVQIDTGQISQVVNNLLINAIEAMPNGGVVNITGCNRRAVPAPLPCGKYVEVAIRDHGHGIAADHVEHIFDPYFSTKRRGSGLGLATAYSIVVRHDGLLTVESTPGRETTFRFFLPASPMAELSRTRAIAPAARGGRILVMDDEPELRQVLGEMLGELGYECELTQDGTEAIERYRLALDEGRAFDAVLMDLTVPGGMGGDEAFRRILSIDPGVRGVVVSGYSNAPVVAAYREHGFRAFLTKPFRLDELARVLGEVVGSPPSRADPRHG